MITLNVSRKPIDQTWSIERIASEAPPATWEDVFADAKAELHDVSTILDDQERQYGPYYPMKQDIFNAFNLTSLQNVKAVIMGQDPYHQSITLNGQVVPRATGLSFSVRKEDKIPSSLLNIYKELENSVRGFHRPDHGDLSEWGKQGVLLLNSCLTVRPNHAKSHGDIWHGFLKKVFKAIAAVNPYCIFFLWGREAQAFRAMIGERSVVFEAAHPSGFSVNRGFFGCNHFNLANDALIKQGKIGINWKISTLTELKNVGVPRLIIVPQANTNHRANLAPINVAALPTIIPVKQPSATVDAPVPTVTLPGNIIPLSQIVGPAPKGLPTLPKSGTTPTFVKQTTQTEGAVPVIPKIQFGALAPQGQPLILKTEPVKQQVPQGQPLILSAAPRQEIKPVTLPLIPTIIQ